MASLLLASRGRRAPGHSTIDLVGVGMASAKYVGAGCGNFLATTTRLSWFDILGNLIRTDQLGVELWPAFWIDDPK